MDKEKMNGRELTEKELNQVSGGASITEDAKELIAERKGRTASIAEAKAPVFKAEMKDINNKELNDKDLEQVNGGQVEESVILAHAEKAKAEATKMKKLQSKVITSAGTMSVMVINGAENKKDFFDKNQN